MPVLPFCRTLMTWLYTALSDLLQGWHAAWSALLGEAGGWDTSWPWVLGIVSLVLTVRVMLLPLFVRQIRAQRAAQTLQPKVAALRREHRDDPASLRRELAELYRVERANPLAGCLPMLVQAPVFVALLHVLRHLRPGITGDSARSLYGWTLTQFDAVSHATLFGAPISAGLTSSGRQLAAVGARPAVVWLVAAVLIVTMAVTAYLTGRGQPDDGSADPQQRLVRRLMVYGVPLSLLVSGAVFPISVLLYWWTQNLVALAQQRWARRRYPSMAVPPPGGPTR